MALRKDDTQLPEAFAVFRSLFMEVKPQASENSPGKKPYTEHGKGFSQKLYFVTYERIHPKVVLCYL